MDKKIKFSSMVFDLDGTILNSKKEVLPSSLEAIKNLQKQNGINVAIASGRPWYFCKRVWNQMESKLPIISCNGALVYDCLTNKVLFVNPIKKSVAKSVHEFLHSLKINYLIYTSEKMYKNLGKATSNWFNWLDDELAKLDESEKFVLDTIDNNFDIDQHDIVKFLIIAAESTEEEIAQVQSEVSKYSEWTYMLRSQKTVLDIMPINSDKGQGLKELAKQNFLDLDQTIVFGDEINDVPMFKVAKYSVAMGQSSQEIKQQATFVTDSNNEDGIANFIKKVL